MKKNISLLLSSVILLSSLISTQIFANEPIKHSQTALKLQLKNAMNNTITDMKIANEKNESEYDEIFKTFSNELFFDFTLDATIDDYLISLNANLNDDGTSYLSNFNANFIYEYFYDDNIEYATEEYDYSMFLNEDYVLLYDNIEEYLTSSNNTFGYINIYEYLNKYINSKDYMSMQDDYSSVVDTYTTHFNNYLSKGQFSKKVNNDNLSSSTIYVELNSELLNEYVESLSTKIASDKDLYNLIKYSVMNNLNNQTDMLTVMSLTEEEISDSVDEIIYSMTSTLDSMYFPTSSSIVIGFTIADKSVVGMEVSVIDNDDVLYNINFSHLDSKYKLQFSNNIYEEEIVFVFDIITEGNNTNLVFDMTSTYINYNGNVLMTLTPGNISYNLNVSGVYGDSMFNINSTAAVSNSTAKNKVPDYYPNK